MIRKTNAWTLIELSPDEILSVPRVELLKDFSSGTLVVWQELARMFQGSEDIERTLPEKMNVVREHLSLVFHRYLSGDDASEKFSILVNNLPVEPADPFLLNRNTQAADELSIRVDGTPIKIVPYMLPFPSRLKAADKKLLGLTADLQRNQGFYVYRNKRLIVWGTWFRRSKKDFLSQLARIRIDIPPTFDRLWVLDVKKSVAIPPPVIRQNLDALIEKISERSRWTWKYRGRREHDKNFRHVWNRLKMRDGAVTYEIDAEYPMFLRLIEKFPACEREFKNFLRLIAAELPLNQLTLDLGGNNVAIENADLYSAENVREILKIFTDGMTGDALKKFLDDRRHIPRE